MQDKDTTYFNKKSSQTKICTQINKMQKNLKFKNIIYLEGVDNSQDFH